MSSTERLGALTMELVDIASVSRDEARIVEHLRATAPRGTHLDLIDDEDTCLLYLPSHRRAGVPLVLFAGHVDTVPIAGNVPGRRDPGVVHGRGSTDQKAGLAVMLALMQDIADGALRPALDAGFLFFGREEIDESALAPCLVRHRELADEVALAVVTEPTDNAVEIGCLGNLNARVIVRGVAAHSARPWLGRNAIHEGIQALASLADLPVRDVEIDGLVYREVINVTTIDGGVAANVIPDRLIATVNFRYAPNHTPADAETRIRELLGAREVEVQIVSNAAGGPVVVGNPLVQRLRSLGDLPVRPKQAWTPVAEFGEAGIAAVNFGPGDPGYAHRDDEQVTEAALARCYELSSALLREDPSIQLSPAFRAVEPYPFEELDRRKAVAMAAGRELLDFGVGDPREETPAFIREALAAAITPVSSYPRAAGLPELRDAIAAWTSRRFGVELDPASQILPTLGSKELVFSLAQAVVAPSGGKDLILTTAPGYPIPERGGRYAGASVHRLALTEAAGFLPDLDAIDPATWDRAAVLWLNYPNNPTGATAPIGFLDEAAERCRAHGVLLAADEAYSELWFDGGPPASALQVGDLTNVAVINTLSKRSSMTGYRSGFVAGDPTLIGALRLLRPSVGVTPQEFVQRASIAAWADETHVEANRARYAAKRHVFLAMFARRGLRVAGSRAGLYLWVGVPGGLASAPFAYDVLERTGVIMAPGSFFGPEGEGFVRLAMVPALADCERAAALLEDVLAEVAP